MEAYVKKFGLVYEDRPENEYLKKVSPEEVDAYIATETPVDRLERAYWPDKYGHMAPEAKHLADSAVHVGFISFFLCNYFTGRQAHFRYHATNQISVFETRYKAMRAYMDFVFVRAMAQSAAVALKFTAFACLFIGGSKAVAVAKNRSSLTDFTAGGAIAGSVMKMNMGLRGCAVAGLVGGVLGTVAGLVIYPIQKYANLTEEQQHRAVVAIYLAQQKYYAALIGSGQKVPTARDERLQRREERMAWLKNFFIGKKEKEEEEVGSLDSPTNVPQR